MEENYQAGQVAAGQVAAGLEAGPDAERLERRGNSRYAVDAAATLVVVNQGGVLSGRIFDLSLDGCGLRTESRQSLTAPVPVEISFKTNGIAFRFAGVMERTDDQSVAGVRFGAMPLRRREVLIEVLEELDAKEKARAATSESPEADKPQPVPGNAPDRPAKVPPASSPRTAASSPPKAEAAAATQRTPLTGSLPAPVTPRAPVAPPAPVTPRAPVAPPAPVAPSAPAAPSPPRRGSDRRAQRRHTVDTRAVIYFIDVAAAVNGRILDLSLSGCRIRTDERFPSGIYRRIETEFRAAGLPFRLAGVVQSVHDRHTVGIRFLDLSERKRGQLCELMEEIADGQPNPEPGAGITAPDPPQPEAPSPQSS